MSAETLRHGSPPVASLRQGGRHAPVPDYHRAVRETSLAQVLRSRGLRMTPQRQLVLEAVRQLGHATPEQVHAAVLATADSVNITTIYRSLELLEELGLVTHTHLSRGAPTYHVAGERPHIHLVCRGCGTVQDEDPSVLRAVTERLAAQRGFLVDVTHVSLFGLCAGCATPAGVTPGAAAAGPEARVEAAREPWAGVAG
jgi:Fur family ferric uptake transcriptional regulator